MFPEIAVLRCDVDRDNVKFAIRLINNEMDDNLFDVRAFFEAIFNNFQNLKNLGPDVLKEHIEIIFCDFVDVYTDAADMAPMHELAIKFFRALEKNKWAKDFEDVYVLGVVNEVTPIIGKGYLDGISDKTTTRGLGAIQTLHATSNEGSGLASQARRSTTGHDPQGQQVEHGGL